MKAKHQRLIFILSSVIFLCVGGMLTLSAFRENLIFFYSPSDIDAKPITPGAVIRLGGLVENGSLEKGKDGQVHFALTDGHKTITVAYKGMLPNLFREGQGVIAEGTLEDGQFKARTILAKHDETYMPKEVSDALKRSGYWKEQK